MVDRNSRSEDEIRQLWMQCNDGLLHLRRSAVSAPCDGDFVTAATFTQRSE
jgi:hypothetical protein